MYSRKRSTPKPKKRKITPVVAGVDDSKSPKEDEDNLCPVCEDSCNCGKSTNLVIESCSLSDAHVELIADLEKSPSKKRMLVEYSSNTSHSGFSTDGGFSSEDDHIAYLLSDSSCSLLSDYNDTDNDGTSSDESDEITYSFSFVDRKSNIQANNTVVAPTLMAYAPLSQPQSFSQVIMNKPATFVDVYSSYYMSSDSDAEESEYDETKATVQIEDVLVESATSHVKQKEPLESNEDFDRWERIPINAFRRRTRRQSAPSLELTTAIKNCIGRESIHSTLFSEPPFQPILFSPVAENAILYSHRHSVPYSSANEVEPTPTPLSMVDELYLSACSSPTWSMDNLFDSKEHNYFWHEI